MAVKYDSLSQIYAHGFDALIDARSPSEHAEDHLPGAISLPVFSDSERAEVGTIYKQRSAFAARKIGAALLARNVAAHLEGPLAGHDGAWRPLIYCWRGGQRSGAFATILRQVGWRAETIEGGYRSYRRLVTRAMYDTPLAHALVVLEGHTGTAKTELLHLMAARGAQILDLEGMAAHRGSVFGATAEAQPSQKAFEGALAHALWRLDPARPVVVEAESSKIGELLIPPSVWKAMRQAPRLRIEAPGAARAAYLVARYADICADPDALCEVIAGLRRHQGAEQVRAWQQMARAGAFRDLAQELMARHYDPAYARQLARRETRLLGSVRAERLDEAGLAAAADRLVALLEAAFPEPRAAREEGDKGAAR